MASEKKKRHWLSRLSFGTVSLVFSALLLLGYLSIRVNYFGDSFGASACCTFLCCW